MEKKRVGAQLPDDWQTALDGLARDRASCKPEEFNLHFSEEVVRRQDDQVQLDYFYRPVIVSAQQRIARFLEAVGPADGVVIDLGSGVGTMVYHLVSAGGTAFGFDYSPTSIQTAVRLHRRLSPAGCWAFSVADTGMLPLADACADIVTMADFIEHLTANQKERTLREVMRILRPGGRVVIGTPNLLAEKRTEWLDRYWHHKQPDLTTLGHIGLIDPWRLCGQMRRFGLVEIDCVMFVESLPGLGWLCRWPAAFARVCALVQNLPIAQMLAGNYFIARGRKPDGQADA